MLHVKDIFKIVIVDLPSHFDHERQQYLIAQQSPLLNKRWHFCVYSYILIKQNAKSHYLIFQQILCIPF